MGEFLLIKTGGRSSTGAAQLLDVLTLSLKCLMASSTTHNVTTATREFQDILP
jgi:hypothetical protein